LTFKEAIMKLDIEDYGQRIFDSNSHGELFHLGDYIAIAEVFSNSPLGTAWFRGWFTEMVAAAEAQWQRPESIFQHIPKLLKETMDQH